MAGSRMPVSIWYQMPAVTWTHWNVNAMARTGGPSSVRVNRHAAHSSQIATTGIQSAVRIAATAETIARTMGSPGTVARCVAGRGRAATPWAGGVSISGDRTITASPVSGGTVRSDGGAGPGRRAT